MQRSWRTRRKEGTSRWWKNVIATFGLQQSARTCFPLWSLKGRNVRLRGSYYWQPCGGITIAILEPAIPKPAVICRPDLILDCQDTVIVLDVTIVADNADLYQAHQHKCDFYDQPGIRDWVSRNVSTASPTFSPVTLNWVHHPWVYCQHQYRALHRCRALHWYRRGHGFDSHSSLNFFRFLLFNCLSWNTLSAVQICDYFIYSYSLKISLSDLLVMLAL